MTKNSISATVGRIAVDVYLDSVERALLAVHAPCGDRLHVLQDIESQIADMLARQPPPLTEEAVQAVIATLELPRHFAEAYGREEREIQSPLTDRSQMLPYNRWVIASAISCTLIPLSGALAALAVASGIPVPELPFFMLIVIVACVLTPVALWKGFKQLRADPSRYFGREIAIGTMTGYFSTVPLLVLAGACLATRGYILFPLAVATFIYLQYLLVRRIWRYMADALPTKATFGSIRDTHERSVSSTSGFAANVSAPTISA